MDEKTVAPDPIHFGTDGWRAILGDDFNHRSAARVAAAAARVFREANPHDQVGTQPTSIPTSTPNPNTIIIGYDTRRDAGKYAALVATIVAAYGFEVLVSNSYCPTPTLCWSVARNPTAVGGLMLTSSHNPAEYLGIKLRMSDGGAASTQFTNQVEAALTDELPERFEAAVANFEAASNGTPDDPAGVITDAPYLQFTDLMTPYLSALTAVVDGDLIGKAGLRLVIDPLYGAGRGYLARTLSGLGVQVTEINNANDPSFDGLHPEPIMPWASRGAEKVRELGYDACFITDGDADRIAAIDAEGEFVSPQRILALLIGHLVEDKLRAGRVIRTVSGSNLIKRQCDRLGLDLVTTPIGFKWIYEQMQAGNVLIGGEEGGGIGIPSHVFERDGLLMALLITELMAERQQTLRQLIDSMLAELGALEFSRRDLKLTPEQKQSFLTVHLRSGSDVTQYAPFFSALGEQVESIERVDGIKLNFASDAWLLLRPSGTEPLVRVYGEAATTEQLNDLLDIGCALVTGELS
jgi:phosphomannomutase